MERERRFSPSGLQELRGKNYDFVVNTANILNKMKGYEVGYSNPRKGKMIVNYNGVNYMVDIEPIGTKGEPTLGNAMKEYGFIFKDEINTD